MSGGLSQDQPDAQRLLRLAQELLRGEVARSLSGAARYQALLAARSLDAALEDLARDPEAFSELEADLEKNFGTPEAVKQGIRRGAFDANGDLHAWLTRWLAIRSGRMSGT